MGKECEEIFSKTRLKTESHEEMGINRTLEPTLNIGRNIAVFFICSPPLFMLLGVTFFNFFYVLKDVFSIPSWPRLLQPTAILDKDTRPAELSLKRNSPYWEKKEAFLAPSYSSPRAPPNRTSRTLHRIIFTIKGKAPEIIPQKTPVSVKEA